jgi:hypothetical protein
MWATGGLADYENIEEAINVDCTFDRKIFFRLTLRDIDIACNVI